MNGDLQALKKEVKKETFVQQLEVRIAGDDKRIKLMVAQEKVAVSHADGNVRQEGSLPGMKREATHAGQ